MAGPVIDLDVSSSMNGAERAVVAAVRNGDSTANLAIPRPHPSENDGWDELTVGACIIVALVTDGKAGVPNSGVKIEGYRIKEDIDLRWTSLECPLVFEGCRLDGRVQLNHASVKDLAFRNCHLLHGLDATRVEVKGCLELSVTTVVGRVNVDGAQIGGDFHCGGSTLGAADAGTCALEARGMKVQGGIELNDGFGATGTANLAEAEIGHNLICNGGTFTGTPLVEESPSPGGPRRGLALNADRAKIKGDVLLSVAFTDSNPVPDADGQPLCFAADGGVTLEAAEIGGKLICDGGTFTAATGFAFNATGIKVTGDVSLGVALGDGKPILSRDQPIRFTANGTVELGNATIDGDLIANGGQFLPRPGAAALQATCLTVARNVMLGVATDGDNETIWLGQDPVHFFASGEVLFLEATVGAGMDASGGEIRVATEEGDAFSADGIKVADCIYFGVARGNDGAPLSDPNGRAVSFNTNRCVRLVGAEIGGNLDCRGGSFTCTDGIAALFANVSAVRILLDTVRDPKTKKPVRDEGGDVRFSAEGEVRLEDAKAILLSCRGASFKNPGPDKCAFNARGMRVESELTWTGVTVNGNVDLQFASVEVLDDDTDSWGTSASLSLSGFTSRGLNNPGSGESNTLLSLNGLTYSALNKPGSWKDRREWLALQQPYASQPYRLLSRIYEGLGDDVSARKIAMAQFNAQLPSWWWTIPYRRRSTTRRVVVWRRVLQAVVGHGYEPWRAGYWAIGALVLASILIFMAAGSGAMVATRLPAGTSQVPTGSGPAGATLLPDECDRRTYPCLNRVAYAAELILPLKLEQRENWRLIGGYRWIVPIFVGIGWILIAFVLAGFTSLVRRL